MHPSELQLKASKSVNQNTVSSNGYGTKPGAHFSRPSKSYITSNKASSSFKKSKMTKSLGPTNRNTGGAGRAEKLTNGYKSLRAQGLLLATRVPDDVAD